MQVSASYDELVKISASLQVGIVPGAKISDREITKLVLEASALSFGADGDRQVAYDIVTRLLEVAADDNPGLIPAARGILARLANFPGIELIKTRYGTDESRLMGLEEAIRRAENSVKLSERERPTLNDFQFDYLDKFKTNDSLSVSGPTSVGKSFALLLLVMQTLKRNPAADIVYLVPTRALIRQVTRDLRHHADKCELADVVITAVPRFVEDSEDAGTVYVLTQERLHSLLYSSTASRAFDLIIVDEATEVGNRNRGVLLERSVGFALAGYKADKIVFSSALCSNPESLNALFLRKNRADIVRTQYSPVTQNIFFLNKVPRKKKQISCSVAIRDGVVDLGVVDIPFEFRESERLPAAALHFTRSEESTIVYANRAYDAERYAGRMANVIMDDFSQDPDIAALCEFLGTFIHPDYSLIRCLRRGVGFHYGAMPDIVREEVETLFGQRKIRFICSTSTLLQGVNLPAKNIFLLNPKRGISKPIEPHDFWNLIGRAGRLGKEFHGNIWCLDRGVWEKDPLLGSKEIVVRDAFSCEVERSGAEIVAILGNRNDVVPRDAGVEQAVSKIVADYYLEDKRLGDARNLSIGNPQVVEQIDGLRASVIDHITVPKEVLKKNPGYSPWRLEELKGRLLSAGDLRELMPLNPYRPNAYPRHQAIVQVLGTTLVPMAGDQYIYYTWLSFQWMFGSSLGALIEGAIRKKRERNEPVETEEQLSSVIREVIETVDKIVRFQLVSGFKAYLDVIGHCLQIRGMGDLIEELPSIHIFLEFGTADPVVMSLIGAGLSRSTALELLRTGRFAGVTTERVAYEQLRNLQLDQITLPEVCKRELRRLLG